MAGTREDWFPTSVWVFDHPDATGLNAALGQYIARERQADAAGVAGRSNALGWQSRHDLHRRGEFKELVGFLEACVAEVVGFLHWDLRRVAPVVLDCWAVVNGPGASNTVHNHPNCFLSGVYYVEAPPDCGDLFFLDPRAAAVMMALPLTRLTP